MAGDLLSLATLVGVCAAVLQLRQLKKQRRRDFEAMFVQRFWSINDRLSLDVINHRRPADGAVTDEDCRLVLAYLALCEDELDLRAGDWITTETWRLWWSGIRIALRQWPYHDVLREVQRADESRPTEDQRFSRIRRAQEHLDDARFEPCHEDCGRRLRHWPRHSAKFQRLSLFQPVGG